MVAKKRSTPKSAPAVADVVVTNHSTPATARLELAASAAWEITTIADELSEKAALIEGNAKKQDPVRLVVVIKLLAARAHELGLAAALALQEDEDAQPIADLERMVYRG